MMRLLSLLVLCLLSVTARAELVAQSQLERQYGLQLGDEVTMTVTLPVATKETDTTAMPETEARQGPWFYLRAYELNDRQLKLHLQVMNVPIDHREVMTPRWQLRTVDDEFIDIERLPVVLGSAVAREIVPDQSAMQPDLPAPAAETAIYQQRLLIAVAVLVLTALVLMLWHLGLRPRQQLPFARARLRLWLMRLRGQRDVTAAARVLHGAFNQSAGAVVVSDRLDTLFAQCPWLQPLASEIRHFYQHSASQFFSRQSSQSLTFEDIAKLVRACREREKMA